MQIDLKPIRFIPDEFQIPINEVFTFQGRPDK